MMMTTLKRGRLATALCTLALLAPVAARAEAPASAPVAAAQAEHPRVLPLEGGQNFRDLGGYPAAGGKTVRWGVLFRSGSMSRLTPADFAYLDRLGIRTIADFRSTDERAREPVAWPADKAPNILADDYQMDMAAMIKALSAPGLDAAKARDAMATLYRDLPFQFAGQYRRMFAQLLGDGAPLAFNCSAGKDRTGVAAALLLTALGVPRETVIQDYLLSNQYFRPDKVASSMDDESKAFFAKLPPDAIKAMMGVDRSYIEAALDAIESRPGGLDGYFSNELGLSKVDIAALRSRYLQ